MASEGTLGAQAGATSRQNGPRPPMVVVVGSVNRDYVCRVPAVPRPGETVLGAELTLGSGGKGGNQAVAAALLGAPTALVARVGADADGAAMLESLASAGVDVDDVVTVADGRSGAAFVMVTGDGENAIVVAPGTNGRLGSDEVGEALGRRLRPGDVVVVQAEIPTAGIAAAADAAGRLGARFVLNLAPYQPLSDAVLRVCDPLVVNEGEARALLGIADDADTDGGSIAARLGERARSAVVTLGGDGALLVEAGAVRQVPTERVPVVDTTGAGDAFTGALAAALCGGADLTAAVRLGVAAGSHAVGRAGTQRSYPRPEDLTGS